MARLDVRAPKVTQKVKLKVKADTGANANVLSIRCLKQMYSKVEDPTTVLQPSSTILTAAIVNGSTLQQIGNLNLATTFDDSVLAQLHGKRCEPATVNKKLSKPRSYTVETPKNRTLRRNRKYIKEIPIKAAKELATRKVTFDLPDERQLDELQKETTELPAPRRSSRVKRKRRDSKRQNTSG
ncbi:hypothetical protein CAPTEDRAFT_200708 [Capitella teleta]|uniref:Uncharacterized protein n=1 Tax=Capitella teleta TaxID=283909 RepID=R7UZ54_CAPTE|nr:hypothetical protein CAPTEDRAFT_200708 [Capitella teleta]|eukprot:ELU09232.1 hypothetical protein CAPTEDRAFT_200708 [Capitella teleta]